MADDDGDAVARLTNLVCRIAAICNDLGEVADLLDEALESAKKGDALPVASSVERRKNGAR